MNWDTKKWRGVAGIYAISRAGNCLYVGKSFDIGRRITVHLRRFRRADSINIYVMDDAINGLSPLHANLFLSIQEGILIERLCPLKNIQRPNVEFEPEKWPLPVQRKIFAQMKWPNLTAA